MYITQVQKNRSRNNSPYLIKIAMMNRNYLIQNAKYLVGECFFQKKYGVGTCTSVQDGRIIIDFGEKTGIKKFFFPDSIIDGNIHWKDEEQSIKNIDVKRHANTVQPVIRKSKVVTPLSIINDRGINYFVHYTRIDNLESIIKNGLCSVEYMEKHGIPYIPNDIQRLDGRRDAISLSVSFPNYKNFYKARQNADSDWCVIRLDPRKVVELECAYFCTNAANSNWRIIDWSRLNNAECFELMFHENRRSPQIPKRYTTDPQAEIMVKDRIPGDFIDSVVLHTGSRLNKSVITCRYIEDESLFKYRCDVEAWS